MALTALIQQHFPQMDSDIFHYVNSVLNDGHEDFTSADEIFDSVGEILVDISSDKTETEIKKVCEALLKALRKSTNGTSSTNQHRVLDNPINMAEANGIESELDDFKSIWCGPKDAGTTVDQKKLGKAEAKLKQKQDKREGTNDSAKPVQYVPQEATASQMYSRRDVKLDESGKSKDIRIENFDISFADKTLLKGANVTLTYGRRYGLVGRNGIGKSTLLKLIESGSLFIPKHITVLHVEQEVVGNDTPALQAVLECDTIRQNLIDEAERLSKADDPGARLQEVYNELSAIEADKAPARASEILCGLGFTPVMQRKATKEFSGGWRMRIALARALFSKPDLLLLDEPTNMLDMKAIIWLENHLVEKWTSTLLVVSHDRQFLNVVPTDTLHFYNYEITHYKGNFDAFVKTKTEKLRNQEREYEAQMDHRKHIQDFIDKFRFNAKRASLVQSRIKQLEKLPEIKAIEKEQKVVFKFPDPEPLSGMPILQLDEAWFKYDTSKGAATEGTVTKAVTNEFILEGININANLQSRICIVGDNGSGKTTLLKLLNGMNSPTKGIRHTHRNLKIGYFTQHHVDQLVMNQSALEFLATKFPGKPSEYYRAYLGRFGVTGDMSTQPLASLSGGQKSRVAFANISLQDPNLLILDEPTNHLDVETVEALAEALSVYKGGVVLVSHDETLIKLVCKEMWHVSEKKVAVLVDFDQYRKIIEKELESTLMG
ncbi:ATP-binding cassette sub-family F member 3 [Halotydeus destructor]|nr:ATP-binding cassette sub-family F member 3 [Halotydeus destructor]